jgi:HAMP domain-containing protein
MEPTRRRSNRLARKLFWAFLIISLFPITVLLALGLLFSREQLQALPVFLQQRLLIVLIALTLATVALIWFVTGRLGRRVDALARSVRLAAQGNPLEPAPTSGNDEIAETGEWFNRLADQVAHNQNLLLSHDNEENTTRRQAAMLVAQQALMAGSLDDLMHTSLDMFLRHFGCSFGALYLLESK